MDTRLKGGRGGVLLFDKGDVRKSDHLLECLPLRGQPLWSLFAKLVEHVSQLCSDKLVDLSQSARKVGYGLVGLERVQGGDFGVGWCISELAVQ